MGSYKFWERLILVALVIGGFFYFKSLLSDDSSISEDNSSAYSSSTSSYSTKQLLDRGQKFILRQVKSPSTTVFLSYNDNVESLLKEWGINFEKKHDALLIEFETTNGFGGRVRKSLCVFYVNGNPVDYADGDHINKVNAREYISIMQAKGVW